MFSSLPKTIGKFLGQLLLLASLSLLAGSALADPIDPDGGDDPPPPAPRPYSVQVG